MAIWRDGALIFDTAIDTLGFKKGKLELTKLAKGGATAVAALAASIIALEAAGVKYNAQIESYETSFKVMTGSAEKAAQTIETLRVMANKTPFELRDLADATQLLINYGFSADDAVEKMSMLGDISQGNAEKLHRIALAYGQMTSAGKVLLVDTKQMIEAGFNPLQEIAETTGESMNSLYNRISKGTISVDEITASMQRSTSEGGKYFQSMEEQSKTVAGQFSTLKDNWNSFTGAMAESTSETLGNDVLPKLNKALEESAELVSSGAFQGVNDFVKSAGEFVADIIPKAVSGLNTILEHLDLIKSAAVGIGTAKVVSTVAPTAINAAQAIGSLSGSVNGLTVSLSAAVLKKAAFDKLLSPTGVITFTSVITGLTSAFITWQQSMGTTDNALRKLREEHNKNLEVINKNYNAKVAEAKQAELLANKIIQLGKDYKSYTKDSAQAIAKAEEFKNVADKLAKFIPNVSSALYNETGEINVQSGAVKQLANDYIQLAKAKATAEALSDKMKETAARIVDVQAKYDELNPKTGKATIKADDRNWFEKMWAGWKSDNALAQSRKLQAELNSLNAEWDNYALKAAEAQNQTENFLETLGNGDNKSEDKGAGGNGNNTPGGTRAKQQTDEIKKEFEKQYKFLNKALEREEISHAEYYKNLKALRDTYFTEGSDEWEEYTEELGDFAYDTFDDCLDKLEDFKNESLDKINELKDEQRSLKESLIPDKSPFVSGTIMGEKFTSLANYDKEINQGILYGKMLDELFKKRADIPQSVIDEIKGMDSDQAMRYMEALLNSSDAQFNAFIESRKKLEEVASENSTKLMSSEMEEVKRILEEKFGELPEDFFDLGDQSASAFGDAFLEELSVAMANVRNSILSEMNAIVTEANLKLSAINPINRLGTLTTGKNTYNTTYTFNSSKETTTQQLRAARAADTLARLRGGN